MIEINNPVENKFRFTDVNSLDTIDVVEIDRKQHFITFFTTPSTPATYKFVLSINDILPDPGNHNEELYHKEPGGYKKWKSSVNGGKHFHIQYEDLKIKDIKEFLSRANNWEPRIISEDLVNAIRSFYV